MAVNSFRNSFPNFLLLVSTSSISSSFASRHDASYRYFPSQFQSQYSILSSRRIHISSRILRRRTLFNKKDEKGKDEDGDGNDLKFIEQTTMLDEEQSERKLLNDFFSTNATDMGETLSSTQDSNLNMIIISNFITLIIDERFRKIGAQDDFPTDAISRVRLLDFPLLTFSQIISQLERLKIDQERERMENGPQRPFYEIKRDPDSVI